MSSRFVQFCTVSICYSLRWVIIGSGVHSCKKVLSVIAVNASDNMKENAGKKCRFAVNLSAIAYTDVSTTYHAACAN